ncbi:hypothetical protein [Microbacterium murale]|uniref:DUF3168 domain-containing protein n=1 Tax=Microbacterium murale TaxID=1081040 RepID=A0ABU0PEB2_9MICO|nr:hypothetical protein [Microbacterium murale]MDQ0645662.1 hypothetical protein [Microbacterium murale]
MSLAAERKAVAALLTAGGIRTAAHVPSDPKPPLAMVTPGTPYLATRDDYTGDRVARFDIWLVIGTAISNTALADAMDERISEVLAILDGSDWLVYEVSADQWEPAGGSKFAVAIISISNTITP